MWALENFDRIPQYFEDNYKYRSYHSLISLNITKYLTRASRSNTGTLGAPWIQYVVADDVVISRSTEKVMQEKTIRLPQSFFVNSHMHISELSESSSSSFREKRDYFRFCNFNKHLKFSPAVFRAWMEILIRVPKSRLVLLKNPPESELFLREHASSSIENQRLEFLDFLDSPYVVFERGNYFSHPLTQRTHSCH